MQLINYSALVTKSYIALIIGCSAALVLFLGDIPETIGPAVLCATFLPLLATPFIAPRVEAMLFYALVFTCPLEIGKSLFFKPFDSSGVDRKSVV